MSLFDSFEDAAAGLGLLIYGIISLIISVLIVVGIGQLAPKYSGFRILLSEGIANILLLVQFGVWPALTILIGYDPLPEASRPWVHIYINTTSFVGYEHLVLVAWSRLTAIKSPYWFMHTFKKYSVVVCFSTWIMAFGLALYLHLSPWFHVIYYDPSTYGFNSDDFSRSDDFWATFNLGTISLSVVFYTIAVYLYVKSKNSVGAQNSSSSNEASAERRLLFPCVVSSCTYVVSHIAYRFAGQNIGKWGSLLTLFLFLTRSALIPVLLLSMSTLLRKKLGQIYLGR